MSTFNDPPFSDFQDFEIPDYNKYTSEFSDKVAPQTNYTQINEIYDITLNEEMERKFYDIFFEAKILLEVSEERGVLKNARFYFFKETTINAVAYTWNDYNYISISVGFVNFFDSYFNNIILIFTNTDELKNYLNDNPYESGLDTYMYNCIWHFVIRHEQAHLLQRVRKRDTDHKFYFDNHSKDKKQQFDLEKHLSEIDADIFATRNLYYYMKFYHSDKFNNSNRITVLYRITVTLAAILLYFFRTHDTFEDFYTFKKDHPHHLMRIGGITYEFIQLIKEDSELKFTFSREKVLLEVRNICRNISGFDRDKMNRYTFLYEREMQQYADYMDAASKYYPFLITRSSK